MKLRQAVSKTCQDVLSPIELKSMPLGYTMAFKLSTVVQYFLFTIHLRNQILYGQYHQFNGSATLPSSEILLLMSLTRGRSKLQGKKKQDMALPCWFGYYTTCRFRKRPAKSKRVSPNSPPPSLTWRLCVPTDISELPCAFGTNRRSLTVLSGWHSGLILTQLLEYCVEMGSALSENGIRGPSFMSVPAVIPNIAPVQVKFSWRELKHLPS